MRLVRFSVGNDVHEGVVVGEGIVRLDDPQLPYQSISALLSGGESAVAELDAALASPEPRHRLQDVRLMAPISPRKYLAIGMNYRKHADEARAIGVAAPDRQLWFNKQTSCIAGPFDEIDPGVTEKLDYEVELGVVIGAPAKSVLASQAHRHVFGYLVANDVSARDWQFHSPTFTVGKSFDTHGPIGPWIVTADEIADCQALDLRCYVNGELRQSSNTSEMIYTVREQIEYLSTAFTLETGDLLATGTPDGVGVARDPQVYLRPGDSIRCEVEGVGAIQNTVAHGNR